MVKAFRRAKDRAKMITSADNVWITEVPVKLSDNRYNVTHQYLISRSELKERISSSSFIWRSKQKKESEMKAKSEGVRKFYYMLGH